MNKLTAVLLSVAVTAMLIGGGMMYAQWRSDAGAHSAAPTPPPMPDMSIAQSVDSSAVQTIVESEPVISTGPFYDTFTGFAVSMVDYWRQFEPLAKDIEFSGYMSQFLDLPEEIDINCDVRNVVILRHSQSYIEIRTVVCEYSQITAKMTGNALKVTEDTSANGWQGWSFGSNDPAVYIYLPDDDSYMPAISAETHAGSVSFDGVSAASVYAECDAGSVSADNLTAAGSVTLRSDVGSITANGITATEIVLKTATGRASCLNSTAESADVKSNVGSVDFENCNIKEANLSTNTGSVNIRLPESASRDVSLDLATDLGGVTVWGMDEGSHCVSNADSPVMSIRARTNVGSISVK